VIKSIRANNFLSWEKLIFKVKDGVTLIDGYNRDDETSEGSGKSAVLNALAWGLYGKIPKDANIDDVIKSGQKSCGVLIELEGVAIHRTRKPNDVWIENIGTNEKIKGKDARETQKMIEELVGMTFDTFCQTVYFPQNYPKKFITASQEDRGKILSEIQDLQIFDKARKEVMSLQKITQDKINNIQMDLREANLKSDHCSKEIEYIKQQDAQQTEARQNQLNLLNNQIRGYDHDISVAAANRQTVVNSIPQPVDPNDLIVVQAALDEMDQTMAGIRNDIANIDSHNKQLVSLQSQLNFYDRQSTTLVTKLDKLQNFVNDPSQKCPMCGSDMEDADTSHAEKEIEDLKNQIRENGVFVNDYTKQISEFTPHDKQQLTEQLTQLANQKAGYQNAKNQIESAGHQITNKNNEIALIDRNINQLNQNIANVKTQIAALESTPLVDYQAQIDVKTQELVGLREQVLTLEKLLEDNQAYFNRLSDLKNGFKEVKSYTFNSVLAELTVKTNKYLQQLFEVPVRLKFTNDNMKIGVEVTMNGETRGLGLLSGGQFRRACLSVDLALSEIVALRTGSKMNIRILDEYFKDLSESSMEKCLRLLEKLGGSTILIEHNSIFKSIVDNVFECELIDGTTRSVA
jgi:DNA repair exonuclease SbcCD ATPase subunit